MKCFVCGRSKDEILLLKLPFEAVYNEHQLIIMGNMQQEEYMCLACMGFQYDDCLRKKPKKTLI